MGAKAWFIAYFDDDPKEILKAKPSPDRVASRALAERMFPNHTLEEMTDGTLTFLNPDEGEVFVGDYGGLRIVAHLELASDFPSSVDPRWVQPNLGETAYLHATHSVVDWFAFALWRNGQLVRSLSVSPDDEVIEDIGAKLPFETPYWNGDFPADGGEPDPDEDAYPLPFHPLDLAEAVLLSNLGFEFEGHPGRWVCDPEEISIMRFRFVTKPWWKFW